VSHLEEGPDGLLRVVCCRLDLGLAEVHKVAGAQRGLQLLGARQEGRLRDDLAQVHHALGGLLWARLQVVQRHQLPAKLPRGETCVKIRRALERTPPPLPGTYSTVALCRI